MFRTWNHLAWRRAARASRHFCLSKTSAGSFTIPEVTSKNGFQVSKNGAEERVFDQVSQAAGEQTHCHTYWSVGFHDNLQQSAHSLKNNNNYNKKKFLKHHKPNTLSMLKGTFCKNKGCEFTDLVLKRPYYAWTRSGGLTVSDVTLW